MLTLPKTFSERMKLFRTGKVATCWKIVQQIGINPQTYRFTDWPEELHLAETTPGTTSLYTPAGGFDGSARRRTESADGDVEARGILTADALRHEDFSGRRFDNARVTEYVVLVNEAWKGPVLANGYYIEGVVFDGIQWRAQCRGLVSLIGESAGEIYGPTCRTEVFSTKCGLLRASFIYPDLIVTDVSVERLTFQVVDMAVATNGYYDDGEVIWKTGANAGIISMARTQTIINPLLGIQEFTLQSRTPRPIELDDTVDFLPGCNKLPGVAGSAGTGDCKNKYNNLINFQGEPYIPGRDVAVRGSRLV